MNLEIKIFIFWLFFTLLFYAITKMAYRISDTSLRWKYYKEEYWAGAVYHTIFALGCTAIAVYAFIKLATWRFN